MAALPERMKAGVRDSPCRRPRVASGTAGRVRTPRRPLARQAHFQQAPANSYPHANAATARCVDRCAGRRARRQETLHPRGGTPANNPLACFVGVSGRECTPIPRHQETKETTKELRRVSHPFHVSDHRGAFPIAEVAEAHLRIFPDCAGIESDVIRRDLAIDAHLLCRLSLSSMSGISTVS